MVYGNNNVVKVVKKHYPKKLERKSMLSAMVLRSYKGGRELSASQIQQLKMHSKHHTISHMKQMIVQMVGGNDFSTAHRKSQKKIGK